MEAPYARGAKEGPGIGSGSRGGTGIGSGSQAGTGIGSGPRGLIGNRRNNATIFLLFLD